MDDHGLTFWKRPPWAAIVAVMLPAVAAVAARAEAPGPDRPVAEAIDSLVDAKLAKAGVTPAPPADDATIARRLWLDLAGRIPTAGEAREYVASSDPQKQRLLIERLLASPWFTRHLATELNTLLRGIDGSGPDLRKYLLAAIAEKRPWNRMFRELLGTAVDPLGPEQFIVKRINDKDQLARDVSSMFFGINIACCQCHTHPDIDTLTQDYFFGMKAFFSRTYEFHGRVAEKRFGQGDITYKNADGEDRTVALLFLSGTALSLPDPGVPDLNKAMAEESKAIEALRGTFAKDKAYPPAPPFSPLGQLLGLVEQPENRLMMAKSLVNRTWFRLMGHGLVMRVDQMHEYNPGSHPELLDWLAQDLVAHDWDLRRLIGGIAASRAYSRSSAWSGGTPPPEELFAVAQPRALTPMQFGMSVFMLGDPAFDTADGDLVKRIEALEARATQTFGTLLDQPHLDGFQINVREPLWLSNFAHHGIATGAALVPALVKLPDTRERIEAATWTVLGRPPTEQEAAVLGEYLAGRVTVSPEDKARITEAAAAIRPKVDAARARLAEINASLAAVDPASLLVPATSPGWKQVAAASLQDQKWFLPQFDDASWQPAKTPLGYGVKLVEEKQGDTLAVQGAEAALRRVFEIDAARRGTIVQLRLQVASNDSAAVYLNGRLIDDDPSPHPPTYWNRSIDVPTAFLAPGRNVVAVRLRNAAKSPDAFLDLQLTAFDAEAVRRREALLAEQKEVGRVAGTSIPAVASPPQLLEKALREMTWALVAGSEFRFNH